MPLLRILTIISLSSFISTTFSIQLPPPLPPDFSFKLIEYSWADSEPLTLRPTNQTQEYRLSTSRDMLLEILTMVRSTGDIAIETTVKIYRLQKFVRESKKIYLKDPENESEQCKIQKKELGFKSAAEEVEKWFENYTVVSNSTIAPWEQQTKNMIGKGKHKKDSQRHYLVISVPSKVPDYGPNEYWMYQDDQGQTIIEYMRKQYISLVGTGLWILYKYEGSRYEQTTFGFNDFVIPSCEVF
ncbi:hypothetical protein FGO68_gene13114 [Halteria grandinella]|uniref:Uncharacterized protein n=1 Tax=Halteria grandinella TaxID=5974 RepID=A0A8J8NJY2_HALGN|nr:hypothetical protein FGO68_gene13114 [Halteria grandinella]